MLYENVSKIFKNETALRPEYIPETLPFRDAHLNRLEHYFSEFIENPGSVCPKVILVGKTGTGKTVTARKFGQSVETRGKNRKVRYIHVSCFIHRKLFSLLRDIGQQLGLPVPKRGLSVSDLIQLLLDLMEERDLYSVITLDDVFHLVNSSDEDEDQLGSLIKLSEEVYYRCGKYRFCFILISQDTSFLDRLDRSARSILGNVVIEFEPYTREQIYKILEQRAELALREGTYSEDVLQMIADVAGVDEEDLSRNSSYRGDARFAIDVLWHAAKIAELDHAEKILPDHVREALKHAVPGVPREYIENLPLHKKLLLLAIVRALKMRRSEAYVSFGFVEEVYDMICEQYGEKPRRHTQLWEYLRDLRSLGIIETRLSGKGRRGRTTLISLSRDLRAEEHIDDMSRRISVSIPAEPLENLERLLEELIKRELGE